MSQDEHHDHRLPRLKNVVYTLFKRFFLRIEGRWFFARKTLDARYLPAGFLMDAR